MEEHIEKSFNTPEELIHQLKNFNKLNVLQEPESLKNINKLT